MKQKLMDALVAFNSLSAEDKKIFKQITVDTPVAPSFNELLGRATTPITPSIPLDYPIRQGTPYDRYRLQTFDDSAWQYTRMPTTDTRINGYVGTEVSLPETATSLTNRLHHLNNNTSNVRETVASNVDTTVAYSPIVAQTDPTTSVTTNSLQGLFDVVVFSSTSPTRG